MSLANKITLFRIILGPLFLISILISPILAGMVVVFHIILDKIDGYLARKRKEETLFGRNLDILVDIIFILFAVNSLLIKYPDLLNIFPYWMIMFGIIIVLLWVISQFIFWKRKKKILFIHSRLKGLSAILFALVGLILIINFYVSVPVNFIKIFSLFVLIFASFDNLDIFLRSIGKGNL